MKEIADKINIHKIVPTFTTVLVTSYKYKTDPTNTSGLVTDTNKLAGSLKDFQFVVAVGPMVRNCKPGDLVQINPSRYAVVKQAKDNSISKDIEGYHAKIVDYNFKGVKIDGEQYILLQDNDIEFVIEDYTEEEVVQKQESKIEVVKQNIILP